MHNLRRLGWYVEATDDPATPYVVRMDADIGTFDTDQEAAQHVGRTSTTGEPQAIAAIRWLKVNSPAEVEAIKKLVNRKTAERIDSI